MARRNLSHAGGMVLHLLNRSAKRQRLFFEDEDYLAFMRVLEFALREHPTRLLAYCLMPNHWHLVTWAIADETPAFMHLLTMTHAKRWHRAHGTEGTGHVYQSRYGAIPVQSDRHFLTLVRYVERNPLRSNLVDRAEAWPWSSLAARHGDSSHAHLLSAWPILRPADWVAIVNQPQTQEEVDALKRAISRNHPFGDVHWGAATGAAIGLPLRGPGRPPKRAALTQMEK